MVAWRASGQEPTTPLFPALAAAGPIGAAFMFYDFVVGLEEEHHVTIPP